MNVLVTGSHGQLGQCLQDVVTQEKPSSITFVFLGSSDLDITNTDQLKNVFQTGNFEFCVNCAAYTAVDAAEEHQELAFKVNAEGVKNIAEVCKAHNTTLIHISTDFVFDGKKRTPYKEIDTPNPINVYGESKLAGETFLQDILDRYFIIRTSWLYSGYGHNFVKTMLRLFKEKDALNVVDDQGGSPTYAGDLAKFIYNIISSQPTNYGVYHFSNLGETTWFRFAKQIKELSQSHVKITPITSSEFPTKAVRPKYSVLSTKKVEETFRYKLSHWKDSLQKMLMI
ncbi:dTDP-4-dehydrorhamnose reductase [Mangrovimonas spongiae]|uniref:dTDP-4-dehydrorhamnose reductase n=1 Tax=Mangrovimonas spongiae TaxID=2494697 RepID=A0A3R9NTQ9_9FLAO|nr:dTDP-4-dehydrorhamnose reductase [Mangrovimonas spongiae]RSK41523.1 dTDP-4-dehydrorhamnose reductase [Mangrovimonas spongiae]